MNGSNPPILSDGILTEKKLVHAGRYIFEKREESGKDIRTIIVSTGDSNKSSRIVWLNEKTNFTPFRIVFLKEYCGDEKLKKRGCPIIIEFLNPPNFYLFLNPLFCLL